MQGKSTRNEAGTYLVDMRVVRKGRGWSGPWQVSRARQDQQRADHTLTLPSAELLANSAALLSVPSPNCRPGTSMMQQVYESSTGCIETGCNGIGYIGRDDCCNKQTSLGPVAWLRNHDKLDTQMIQLVAFAPPDYKDIPFAVSGWNKQRTLRVLVVNASGTSCTF